MSSNSSKDQCLNEMVRLLDASFGNHQTGPKNLVSAVRDSISNLKSSLTYAMAEEVAQLAVNGESEEFIKELLNRNFASGVRSGQVEEMLKLVYVGTNKENLKKVINFVQIFDSSHHALAYIALYEDIKFKKHTEEPEMFLLQKYIRLTEKPASTRLDKTIKQVDENCHKIISMIVRGIKQKDYSISIQMAKSLDLELIDNEMVTIVEEFYTGALDNTLQLIQYSNNLPHIQNKCFLVDAFMKELEKRQMLSSEQAMHFWAYARCITEEPNWPRVKASAQKLCTDAIDKLSPNKYLLLQHYQKYVEDPDKNKIRNLHQSTGHLQTIVRDFVSIYHYGEVDRAQNLLAVVEAINGFYYPLILILSQLHEEMVKRYQLNTFEAFRIFNQVKRFIRVIQPLST